MAPVAPEVDPVEERTLKFGSSTSPTALRIALPPASAASQRSSKGARRDPPPFRIGFHRVMPNEFQEDLSPLLRWVSRDDGSIASSVIVTSAGAFAMRAGIHAELPAGGELHFFGGAETKQQAEQGRTAPALPVITQADFHLEGGKPEILWSPVVEGDSIGVEITLPSREALTDFSFAIEKVSHIYAPMGSLRYAPEAMACPNHVDVQCRAGNFPSNWEDAVARIIFETDDGNTGACSGTLLNDNDAESGFIPYFLTANHCVSTLAAARSVEATWFYQQTDCDGDTIDPRSMTTYGGADLLATSAAQDSTLLRLRGDVPGGLHYSGWSADRVTHPAAVYGIHHPGSDVKKYSRGSTTGVEDVRVCRDPASDVDCTTTENSILVAWAEGTTEPGSSGSGLFDGAHLIGVLSGGEAACDGGTDAYGPFRDFYPKVRRWLDPEHVLPLVTAASDSGPQGFVRIINHSNRAGTVHIDAIDDTGRRFGPVTLSLKAKEAVHFDARALEQGNAPEVQIEGVGDGKGHWRLVLDSALDIEPLAYIRTPDGFLTSIHEVVAEEAAGSVRYRVPFFNPAHNRNQQSRLRLINPNERAVEVTIAGLDDQGSSGPEGKVHLTLPAGTARMLSARQLEQGDFGLAGRLGDGTGRWQLLVSAEHPLRAMSLLRSPTEHLANLSRGNSSGEETLPLVTPASNSNQQGFVRLINRTDLTGTVDIHAIDDAGERFGPVTLWLEAKDTVHFDSRDLELGNEAKGLSGGVGDGEGDWRLELDSEELDLEALAYISTPDGFVTSMHEVVVESDRCHHVPLFNPGSNERQRSRLRLINSDEAPATVTITGFDDEGNSAPGGEVRLVLPAGRARTLSARELESGGRGLRGRLGDGTGRWRLLIRASHSIRVMSLLASPAGHLSNLSTSSLEEGAAAACASDLAPELVRLEGGCFEMGSPVSEPGRDDDEGRHQVCVADFSIGKYEVTRGEYAAFVQATGRSQEDGCWTYEEGEWEERAGRSWLAPGYGQTDTHPVVCVSREDAAAYARWLSGKTGEQYRLPTEAEWEYAARAGTAMSRPWGDDASQACGYANVVDQTFDERYPDWQRPNPDWQRPTHECRDGQVHTAQVGSFMADAQGLHDMLGNVEERTCSEYDAGYGGAEGHCLPVEGGGRRAVRGGSWYSYPSRARSANRDGSYPDARRASTLGFRLARGRRSPDLVVTVESPEGPESGPRRISGELFGLSATVRNQGTGTSSPTTLSWYRSARPIHRTGDMRMGSDPVPALAVSGTHGESILLSAPWNAGTYYYFACVDTMAAGDPTAGNGCSQGLRVVVREVHVAMAFGWHDDCSPAWWPVEDTPDPPDNRASAESRALEECRLAGLSGCKVVAWVRNHCAALAYGESGFLSGLTRSYAHGGIGATSAAAVQDARRTCSNATGVECTTSPSFCPETERGSVTSEPSPPHATSGAGRFCFRPPF